MRSIRRSMFVEAAVSSRPCSLQGVTSRFVRQTTLTRVPPTLTLAPRFTRHENSPRSFIFLKNEMSAVFVHTKGFGEALFLSR